MKPARLPLALALLLLAAMTGPVWAATDALVVADTHASARWMALLVILGACMATFGLLAIVGAASQDDATHRNGGCP
jgi:hypothetical protein